MICIVDAGLGNIGSVRNMLGIAGDNEVSIVTEADGLSRAGKILLPGVGSFDAGITSLDQSGLDIAIRDAANRGAYILGICLGMQLLFDKSEEGKRPGLGLVPGSVERFKFEDKSLKVPHVGWNIVRPVCDSVLFEMSGEEQRFYFVHAYHAICEDPRDVTAVTHHGYDFPCAVQRDKVMGVQFHPEKSHRFGIMLLKKFIELR